MIRCLGRSKRTQCRHRYDVSLDSKLCCPKSISYTKFSVAQAQSRGNNSSVGGVIRASTSGAADVGLIPSLVKPMTLKLAFTASLFDAQHYRDSVENKLASLVVVPMREVLRGIPPFLCDRRVAGYSKVSSL